MIIQKIYKINKMISQNKIKQKNKIEQQKNRKSKKSIQSKASNSLPLLQSSVEKFTAKIDQFRSNQILLTKRLNQSIMNNKIYQSSSSENMQLWKKSQQIDEQRLKKQKVIQRLKKNIQKKMSADIQAQNRLKSISQTNLNRKHLIQNRLKQIKNKNLNRIDQIYNFQKLFINKLTYQMAINQQKQTRLKAQYDKISKNKLNIHKTKQFELNLDNNQWKQFVQDKFKLENLMKNHINKQNKLIQQKNVQEKQQIKLQPRTGKQIRKVRQRVKLDAKQAGKQYLDFAKKKASTSPKKGVILNHNQMNIKLKQINYDNQVLQKMVANTAQNIMKQSQNNYITNEERQDKKQYSETSSKQFQTYQERKDSVMPILQQLNYNSEVRNNN